MLLVTHDVDEALFLADRIRTHDLADMAQEKREILRLLGIKVNHDDVVSKVALAA